MILMKRMIEGSSVTPLLINVIKEMPVGEQAALLEKLTKSGATYKRKHNRTAIRITVDYITRGVKEKGRVRNISEDGLFLETRSPFRKGDAISVRFTLPSGPQKKIKIDGKIVRVSPSGVGVVSNARCYELEDILKVVFYEDFNG